MHNFKLKIENGNGAGIHGDYHIGSGSEYKSGSDPMIFPQLFTLIKVSRINYSSIDWPDKGRSW